MTAQDPSELALPEETDSADGVFEGGGVKGIAFVGALEAAAELGIERWVNVAGTSAGAIVAALLAADYEVADLRRILEETDYKAFADYGFGGKWLGGPRNALLHRGLCPGRFFTTWMEQKLAESPCGKEKLAAHGNAKLTFDDLQRRDLPPDLSDEERKRSRFRLRVVASDITEGRMLVLPDDIEGYEDEHGKPLRPETLEVARAVRMSMSFPYFFEPVTLRRDGHRHLIVDGGLLSNFPIFLFDGMRAPLKRWTFGFRLFSGSPPEELPYRPVRRFLWPVWLTRAMFLAATEAWDRRLSVASAARTISIPTGKVRTLKFELTDDDRDELSRHGHETASAFFRSQRTYRNHEGVMAAGPAALQSKR